MVLDLIIYHYHYYYLYYLYYVTYPILSIVRCIWFTLHYHTAK
jgi:hypothetical protein